MTKEEAIYNLKTLLTMGDFLDAYGDSVCAEPYYEAVDMAVESLKNSERTEKFSQNVPNDDLISRKAAIDTVKKYYRGHDNDLLENIAFELERMPSVPQTVNVTLDEEKVARVIEHRKKIRLSTDAISRQDAIKALKNRFSDEGDLTEINSYWEHKTVIEVIESLPSVQPEQKNGEWEEIEVIPEAYDIAGVKTWASKMRCNQCGFTTFAIEGRFAQYNFCPNCGARMEG